MRWWIDLLWRHRLSVFLRRATYLYVLVMCLVFLPPAIRLIIIIAIGTVMFLLSFVYYHLALLKIKKIGKQPNLGTYGYWVTSGTGLIFSSVLLIPSLLNLSRAVHAPVTWLSHVWILSFFYHVFAFYLVSKAGLDLLSGHKDK